MRRAVPAAVLTIIGLGALASFKSTAPSAARAAGVHPSPLTTPAATAPPTSGGSSPSPTTKPPATAPPRSATTPTTPTTASAMRTVDGDPVDNQYGTVQVRVTVQGHRITDIQALQMPYDRSRSQYISEQAEPLLQQESLQAQSAQIDLVSGATYTSESYMQSLQSALDRAGL